MQNDLRLVADIGGTSSRLALFDGLHPVAGSIRRFDNDAAGSFADILTAFLEEQPVNPVAVCIAAAGPVIGTELRLTNRDWQISRQDVARALGCTRVAMINDLQAMGHALAVEAIAGGPLQATRLVLAIGTGCNAAVAYSTPQGAFVPAAEHGYTTLPFTGAEDAPLLAAAAREFGTPALEAALSGPGLTRLDRLINGTDRTPSAIIQNDPDRDPALAFALRLLGHCLGSLALACLPEGGLYLAGSVGRALFAHTGHSAFQTAFGSRGSYSALMTSFPLRVIDDDTAALHGAARYLDCYPGDVLS